MGTNPRSFNISNSVLLPGAEVSPVCSVPANHRRFSMFNKRVIPVASCSLTLLETKIPSRYLNIGLPTISYVQIKASCEIT